MCSVYWYLYLNTLSLGNEEFLTFSRDYCGLKFSHPQLVIKTFDYILNELEKSGREELSKIYPHDSVTTFITLGETYTKCKFDVAGIEFSQNLGII